MSVDRRLLALAWLGVCATGCLPQGEPPAGRQVLADRDALLAGVLPPSPDGTARLLITRSARLQEQANIADLYLLSVPEAGAPSERLLAQDIGWGMGCRVSHCFPIDARGRLVLQADYDLSTGESTLIRVDPATGERFDVGRGTFTLSASSNRVLMTRVDRDSGVLSTTLYEADGRATVIDSIIIPSFVEEDLYYVTSEKVLMRVVPDGAPEPMRARVFRFTSQQTDAGPLLIVDLVSDDPVTGTTVVLDPTTREEIFPPVESGSSVSVSPDRRGMLAWSDTADGLNIRFIDLTDGAEQTYDPKAVSLWTSEWRPGHAELWLMLRDKSSGNISTWIMKAGMIPLPTPAVPFGYYESSQAQSIFTRDGAYWFSLSPTQPTQPVWLRLTVQVGPADHPSGPRVDVNPEGTASYNYHQLPDGRLLVEAYRAVPERNDVYVVDPATGQAQLLGEQGRVLVAGAHRALASLHLVDGRGDLTVLDLDSGRLTVLAAEFMQSAFVEPGPGPDQVPAGGRVAFHFRARFDSPYDGIWIATLP